jgi:TonB family protein
MRLLPLDFWSGAGRLCVLALTCLFAHPLAQAQPQASYQDEIQSGVGYYRAGNDAEAITTLNAALKKQKDSADGWHFLGLAQSRAGADKRARKSFEKAVALRPDYLLSRTSLASTLLTQNDLAGAEREAKYALTLDAKSPDAHVILGNLRLRADAPAEALRESETALRLNPDFPLGHLLKSQALLNLFAQMELRRIKEGVDSPAAKRAELLGNAAESLAAYLRFNLKPEETQLWQGQLEALRYFADRVKQPDESNTNRLGETLRLKVLHREKLRYTEEAKVAGVRGMVKFLCVFSEEGKIKHLMILQSLSHGLTEQAVKTAQAVRFVPAKLDGRPVPIVGLLEYGFKR